MLTEDDSRDITDTEWAEAERQVIEEFKTFAKRSNDRNSKFYKRIRDERQFESGQQWDDNDKNNRGKDRAEMTINLTGVFVNAVVNPFMAKPFKIKAIARNEKMFADGVQQLNYRLTTLQSDYSTHESNSMAFKDEVGVGLGFTYATIEEKDGERRIRYLHIEDQTMVILDPDAKGVALEDADRIAVVDFMTYDAAKEAYGADIVNGNNPERAMLTNFGSSWEVEKDHVAVITYFRKDGHNVEYFRLCGDHIVDYGVFEGLDYLPVFAFTGDRIWLDDKRTFSGIIRKVKAEQKTINYAQSQLIERLAKSPKGFFLTATDAIEGFEDDYQNAEYGNSYILRYNNTSKTKSPVNPPQFIQPEVRTEDLQGAINAAINQMSVATGISPNGIVEQNLTDQKTATEVLLRTKSSQSNVSNYISHAKESIRIAGQVLAHLCIMMYGIDLPKGSYDIVVEEGCVSLTKMEEDREKLLALAQIIPPEMKGLVSSLLVAKMDIEGGSQLSSMLYNMLPSEVRGGLPSVAEVQAMQAQLQDLQNALAQKDEDIKVLNDQLTQAQLRTKTDLIMEDKRFEHDVQMELLKQSQQQKIDAQDVLVEAKKEQVQNERELEKMALDAKTRLTEKEMDNKARITEKALDVLAGEKKSPETVQNVEIPPFMEPNM